MKTSTFTVAILIAVVLPLFSGAVGAAPRLELVESEFDFGFVPQNSKISHVFWLKSTGDDSLKITKVVPGCGCTQAPLENDVIGAGDSTRLEIIFSTKRYRGRMTKSPRIETNEGPPHKTVRIYSHVVARPDSMYPVVLKPYKLDISQFGETVRSEIEYTITNTADTDINLTLVDWARGVFVVDLPERLKAGESATGTVRILDTALETEFEKSFTFTVDDEQNSRFTVPVKRRVESPETSASVTAIDK